MFPRELGLAPGLGLTSFGQLQLRVAGVTDEAAVAISPGAARGAEGRETGRHLLKEHVPQAPLPPGQTFLP